MKEVLYLAMKKLTVEEFKDFKYYLLEYGSTDQRAQSSRGYPVITQADLENADRRRTVDLIVQTYNQQPLEVTQELLLKVGRGDVVDHLAQSKPGAPMQIDSAATPSAGATGVNTMADGKHFVDKHRIKLIDRVNNIAVILDELLEEDILQQEMYDKIRVLPTSQEKMRELYSGPLKAGGIRCKDKFYSILEKKERYLVDELKEMK
ncbi:hypothetical protein PFLUV_G00185010 [Perca fluviatilis]|uniref:CARD domain-containing protein n=2 Tax=Perca fluviatilis TaxID=8168 RepID=A0A6A5F075_PERFL|nr:hypothetical protein PFLUV_G00185010 [Perca fluviatilis]